MACLSRLLSLALLATLAACAGGPTPTAPPTVPPDVARTQTAAAVTLRWVSPQIFLALPGAGPQPAGARIVLTVTNNHSAPHRVLARLYNRRAPLDSAAYLMVTVDVPAGASASATARLPVAVALLGAQTVAIDGVTDFSPPPP
jgi:hypothetical protein